MITKRFILHNKVGLLEKVPLCYTIRKKNGSIKGGTEYGSETDGRTERTG